MMQKIRILCGGSSALAWLLLLTGGSGLLCMVWLIVAMFAGLDAWSLNYWFALPGKAPDALMRPWTLITYMGVHFSLLHLIFNLLWLYWFGRLLTDVRDDRTLLVLFIGAGLSGGLLYVIVSTVLPGNISGFLTGDSAAVLGVMTAVGILMPHRRVRLILLGEIKLKWLTLGCILLTLLGGGGGIAAQSAHLGGVVWGLGVSVASLRGWKISFPEKIGAKHVPLNTRRAMRAMQQLDPQVRLDQLLDKIRISGYDSLSEREKAELNHISSRIDTRRRTP